MGSFLEDFSRFVTLEFSIARALCKWPGRMAIKLEAILQTGIMMTLVPETETDRVFQKYGHEADRATRKSGTVPTLLEALCAQSPMNRLSEDIRERTLEFASAIACLRMSLPRTRRELERLGDQLLRAAVAVAAQVRQASLSQSDAEMCSRLEGAIQQADESMLCLEMLQDDCQISEGSLVDLRKEADEIIAAFAAIVSRRGGRRL